MENSQQVVDIMVAITWITIILRTTHSTEQNNSIPPPTITGSNCSSAAFGDDGIENSSLLCLTILKLIEMVC